MRFLTLLFILFLANVSLSYSQNENINDSIYEKLDSMPEFPTGQAEMYQFLSKNIHYPNECIEKGIWMPNPLEL